MQTEAAIPTSAAGRDDAPAAALQAQPPAPAPGYTSIAIVGSHPATVMLAPFQDERALIYACSPHNFEMRHLPRFDEWFEIHKPLQDATRGYNYLKFLETVPLVWMRDAPQMHHFPGSRAYPEAEMKGKFCPFLFSSTIAFMMAKAIDDAERLGIKQIGLWGILQSSENEYARQRPGTQYFIWEAARRGIKVLAARESGLFDIAREDF